MAHRRILIIDDDAELCEELAQSLDDEGWQAAYAVDPLEGEAMIRSGNYDTILLDYKMPGITGIDILKKLKGEGIKKRIFIVSGRPAVENMLSEEYLEDMVSGVIIKPIDFEGLLEKIK